MRSLNYFCSIIFILFFLFLLQGERVFSFFGIMPNLIFIFLCLLIFYDSHFSTLCFACLSALFIAFLKMPFWIIPISVMLGSVIMCFGIARLMSGNRIIDYIIILFFGSLSFPFLMHLFTPYTFSFFLLLKEAVYTMIVGVVVWYPARVFFKSYAFSSLS